MPEHSLRRNERSTAITKRSCYYCRRNWKVSCAGSFKLEQAKDQIVIPIVGARKPEQMEDSLGCLDFTLTDEQIKRLDEVSKIELGFPHDMLSSDQVKEVSFGGTHSLIETTETTKLNK